MPPHVRARIKPALLEWARRNSLYSLEAAAKKLQVNPEVLSSWESGASQPTIKQLRRAAKLYRYSLAVFYLPEPPGDKFQPIRDYRRFAGGLTEGISAELNLAIKDAYDRRESALELYQLLGEDPPEFEFHAKRAQSPDELGAALRSYLDISDAEQARWREPRNAFGAIRGRLERRGVLVFQVARIAVEEVRGFAIPRQPLPVVVVNRADTLSGRLFSLIHELTHIALKGDGVCNLPWEYGDTDQKDIEVFCNQVAASTLVPGKRFLSLPAVRDHGKARWTTAELDPIASEFGVSRYVVARRLLTFELIGSATYERLVTELDAEFARQPRPKAMITPAAEVVSIAGRVFPSLVFEAFARDQISASTVSSYLGVRLKHLDKVRQSLDRSA